jgi:hypothetical protein
MRTIQNFVAILVLNKLQVELDIAALRNLQEEAVGQVVDQDTRFDILPVAAFGPVEFLKLHSDSKAPFPLNL